MEEQTVTPRLFLLHGHFIRANAVQLHPYTLHTEHVFMLDTSKAIYLWLGAHHSRTMMIDD